MVDLFDGMKPYEKKDEKKENIPIDTRTISISAEPSYFELSRTDSGIFIVNIKNNATIDDEFEIKMSVNYTSSYETEGAEWSIFEVKEHAKERINPYIYIKKIKIDAQQTNTLKIEIEPPPGMRYGERVDIVMYALSIKDPAISDSIKLTAKAKQAFLAIKCMRGHEMEVADSLYNNSTKTPGTLFSIFVPPLIRGYFFVEGMSSESVKSMIKGISKARGIVSGSASINEITPFLIPQISVAGIVKG
ncbi:MAG: hypothetical protein M1411_01620, partial [Candidatus Thermoplasmatota archaeon]|nr:hypothetical protein [Candidatus Thermoplasmatota archaeon]